MKYTRCEPLLLVKAFFLLFVVVVFSSLENYFWIQIIPSVWGGISLWRKFKDFSRPYRGIQGLFKDFWHSRTFQGLTLKFKDFSRLCEPCNNPSRWVTTLLKTNTLKIENIIHTLQTC